MRPIDADALKKYCEDGLAESLDMFQTEGYKQLAIAVTKSFIKDIDEQPTIETADPKKPATMTCFYEEKRCSMPVCPNCGIAISHRAQGHTVKHCFNCGQAIDWSKEKKE